METGTLSDILTKETEMCGNKEFKSKYEVLESDNGGLVKSWTRGVSFEEGAKDQLRRISTLPFIYKWVAVMPDVHMGMGATIGSVIPTKGAIIPAAVGVDIGCGMIAQKTSLNAADLPNNLANIRARIEKSIPTGRASHKKLPKRFEQQWANLEHGYNSLLEKHPLIEHSKKDNQLGTLGGGNHFIEICLDENDDVWVMLHSGSRGVGNNIARYFIELAREDMKKWFVNLPDMNLAYFPEGTENFKDYMLAVNWAQEYARINREMMMSSVLLALKGTSELPEFTTEQTAVNCHHNYVDTETHFGEEVLVTRKGAISARAGELGIIPGSMGAKSFIVKGLGNEESFCSCSHGAGRIMSRTKAKEVISLEEHIAATEGIECRKDRGVIDESPKAYKNIDAVMDAQSDLVEVVHTLRQIVCIKG